MYSLIYVPSFIPRNKKEEITSDLKIFDNASGDTLSYSIFRGLSRNYKSSFTTINVAPVGPFPKCNKKTSFYGGEYLDGNNVVKSISFSTLFIFQHYSIYSHIYTTLKKCVNKNEDTCVLVYSINISVIKAIIRLKKQGSKIKLVLIIPDFWDDMLEHVSLRNIVKSWLFSDVRNIYSFCDGFVLLTQHMLDKINIKRPYCVVEGMYNSSENRPQPILKNREIKTLFYSGMLHEKFGVKELIEAFSLIENPKLRLRICGSGDYESELKELARRDKRIQILGLLNREEVLKEQANADLLVNPRTPAGDYTKYSFPSKTIEYFASGTPAIIHRLPGIPKEYYDYCFTFKSTQLYDIAEDIKKTLSRTPEEMQKFGTRAQNFIFREKNAVSQTAKIKNLITSIIYGNA